MAKINGNKDISLWLVPEKAQKERLKETIDNLAKKYNSYAFISHITIYCLSNSISVNRAVKIIKEELDKVGPIEIESDGIKYSV